MDRAEIDPQRETEKLISKEGLLLGAAGATHDWWISRQSHGLFERAGIDAPGPPRCPRETAWACCPKIACCRRPHRIRLRIPRQAFDPHSRGPFLHCCWCPTVDDSRGAGAGANSALHIGRLAADVAVANLEFVCCVLCELCIHPLNRNRLLRLARWGDFGPCRLSMAAWRSLRNNPRPKRPGLFEISSSQCVAPAELSSRQKLTRWDCRGHNFRISFDLASYEIMFLM